MRLFCDPSSSELHCVVQQSGIRVNVDPPRPASLKEMVHVPGPETVAVGFESLVKNIGVVPLGIRSRVAQKAVDLEVIDALDRGAL